MNKFRRVGAFGKVAFSSKANAKAKALRAYGGLTFYADYSTHSVDAVYAVGSRTGTFAWSTTDSTRTFIDSSGNIQLADTVNSARIQGGYYDSTGFHAQNGLMMERASTNMLQDTYCADGSTTYWNQNNSAITTDSNQSPPYGTKVLKWTASDATDSMFNASAKRASVTSGSVYTFSCWLKGSGDVYLWFNVSASPYSSKITLTSDWRRYSATFTANSTTTVANGLYLQESQAVTAYATCMQLEALPYATSYIPTTTAALTRNVESLTYASLGNRTGATESIFVKFAPFSTFANDGKTRCLTDTQTKRRIIYKASSGNVFLSKPNITDSGTAAVTGTTTPLINTSYVSTSVFSSTGDPNSTIYGNGTSEATNNTDFTANAYGTSWYLGCSKDAGEEFDGIIQAVAMFSDVKSAADVLGITRILNA